MVGAVSLAVIDHRLVDPPVLLNMISMSAAAV
jgi:hypothetical protein